MNEQEFQSPSQAVPRQWLEFQQQEWAAKKLELEREMMQTIEDHAAVSANLTAIARLLALYE